MTSFLAFLTEQSPWTYTIWSGRALGLFFVPAVLLQRTLRPLAGVAWILALLFLPFLGVLCWWIFGRDHFHRVRRKRRRFTPSSTSRANEHGIFPQVDGNRVSAFTDSKSAFDAFATAIERAQDHIHFQFFIWRNDETGTRFRDLLIKKARQGVEVRAIYDAVGAAGLNRRFVAPLIEAGAQAAPFLPVSLFEPRLHVNFRNHRKLLIIDGKLGFTGGVNIADEYLEWHDGAYGVEGPVVHQMQEIFAEDWFFATSENLEGHRYFPQITTEQIGALRDFAPSCLRASGRVVASGPDDRIDTVQKMFFQGINTAEERLFIITPYFVPDHAILIALQTAALRGVDVRVIVPARTDVPLTQYAGRSHWDVLLETGVRIFEFQDCVLHSKLMIIDDETVCVGSANIDIRSFRFNFEANLILRCKPLSAEVGAYFCDTLEKSTEVDRDRFVNRPRKIRLLEGAARLFSPLL